MADEALYDAKRLGRNRVVLSAMFRAGDEAVAEEAPCAVLEGQGVAEMVDHA